MSKAKYKNVRLVIKENRIEMYNKEDNQLISINTDVVDKEMQSHVTAITEVIVAMGAKYSLNDDYYYNRYGVRLVPTIGVIEDIV